MIEAAPKSNESCALCLKEFSELDTTVDGVAIPVILHLAGQWNHRACLSCAKSILEQPLRLRNCPFAGCGRFLTPRMPGMDERVSELFPNYRILDPEDPTLYIQGWLL